MCFWAQLCFICHNTVIAIIIGSSYSSNSNHSYWFLTINLILIHIKSHINMFCCVLFWIYKYNKIPSVALTFRAFILTSWPVLNGLFFSSNDFVVLHVILCHDDFISSWLCSKHWTENNIVYDSNTIIMLSNCKTSTGAGLIQFNVNVNTSTAYLPLLHKYR